MDMYQNPIAYSSPDTQKAKIFKLEKPVGNTQWFLAIYDPTNPPIAVHPVGSSSTLEAYDFAEEIEPWMDPDIAEKIINLLPYLDDEEKRNELFDVYKSLPWIEPEHEISLLPNDTYGGYFYIRNPNSDFEDDRFFGKDTPLLSFYIAAMFAEEQRAYGMDWNGNVLL